MNFEKLATNVKDKLYRFALRITGDVAEAEDVVQEVFIKVWNKRDDMQEVNNPEAYCMTLTRNLSLDKIKSKHRQTAEIGEALQLTDSESTPYTTLEKNDALTQIRKWMQELPEKQRLTMHLRDIEGMAYDEIAESLDISMAQVKVNLHRARQFIREKMLATERFGIA
ncbi:MAG: sigma-70 family RNA polymerase sigma factor [Saprospiraceae bacterium]|nr:sigma-70 family RNA polymerase sigma factor [Saprospiraceae bacterium]